MALLSGSARARQPASPARARGNKYTDDDISYLTYVRDPNEPRFCERVRECDCVNGKDCEKWDNPGGTLPAGYYCGDPAADPQPGTISGAGVQAANSCT